MFWITLGIGVVIGLTMGIIICALVLDLHLPLGNYKDGKWG